TITTSDNLLQRMTPLNLLETGASCVAAPFVVRHIPYAALCHGFLNALDTPRQQVRVQVTAYLRPHKAISPAAAVEEDHIIRPCCCRYLLVQIAQRHTTGRQAGG